MIDPVRNFAIATLSTGYNSAATSVALTAGQGARFPDPVYYGAFNAVWWNSTDYANPADDPNKEIVRVTKKVTDTLTITRAQESTSASNKNTAAKTYKLILGLTEKMVEDLKLQNLPDGIPSLGTSGRHISLTDYGVASGYLYNDMQPWLVQGLDGLPRFVYIANNSDLHLVRFLDQNGDNYIDTLILTVAGSNADVPVIRIGSDGKPRISYIDYSDNSLHFIKAADDDATSITNTLVEAGLNTYENTFILSASDVPTFAYRDGAGDGIRIISTSDNLGTFSADNLISAVSPNTNGLHMEMSPADNKPRILFSYDDNTIKYAKCSDFVGGSTINTVATGLTRVTYVHFILDAADKPLMVYSDQGVLTLFYRQATATNASTLGTQRTLHTFLNHINNCVIVMGADSKPRAGVMGSDTDRTLGGGACWFFQLTNVNGSTFVETNIELGVDDWYMSMFLDSISLLPCMVYVSNNAETRLHFARLKTESGAHVSSKAGKAIRVTKNTDGFEFFDAPTVFTAFTDVPSSYTGAAGKGVTVKTDETGLEFVEIVNARSFKTNAIGSARWRSGDGSTENDITDTSIQGGTAGSSETNQAAGQPFIAPDTANITAVRVHLALTGGATGDVVTSPLDSVTVAIYSDSAGLPNTQLAISAARTSQEVWNADDVAGGGGYNDFIFATPLAVVAGTKYHVVVERTGARDAGAYYNIRKIAPLIDGLSSVIRSNNSWSTSSDVTRTCAMQIIMDGKLVNETLTKYAAGTVYHLTATAAKLDFGTTDPVLTLKQKGTYLLFARVRLDYASATFAAARTATLKLRRTNNTAADVANATTSFVTGVTSSLSDTMATIALPPVVYITANDDDVIELWGSVSVVPTAGNLDAVEAEIVALRVS